MQSQPLKIRAALQRRRCGHRTIRYYQRRRLLGATDAPAAWTTPLSTGILERCASSNARSTRVFARRDRGADESGQRDWTTPARMRPRQQRLAEIEAKSTISP